MAERRCGDGDAVLYLEHLCGLASAARALTRHSGLGDRMEASGAWDPTPAQPFREGRRHGALARAARGDTRGLTELLGADEFSRTLEDYSRIVAVARAFESHAAQVDIERLRWGGEQDILVVHDCTLIEQRKGARVTVRETTTRSTGTWSSSSASFRLAGVRLGGSSGTSSRTSTSRGVTVSLPAPDLLTSIDTGVVKLTTRRIAFIGDMFTRNTPYPRILGFATDDRRSLLIAPTDRTRTWIVETPTEQSRAFLQIMLMAAEVWLPHVRGTLDENRAYRNDERHPFEDVADAIRSELRDEFATRRDMLEGLATSGTARTPDWRDKLPALPEGYDPPSAPTQRLDTGPSA